MNGAVALNHTVIPYGDPTYWDDRYDLDRKNNKGSYTFDWHANFETVWNMIGTFIVNVPEAKSKKILILGCGNSDFTEQLFKAGYTNITNIDVSAVVVNQMQQRYAAYEGVEFLVMDVRKMDAFLKGSFDVIIDKGALDCLFAAYSFVKDVQMALREICRVLAPGGSYFCISHGGVRSRLPYMRQSRKLKWRAVSLPILGSADNTLYAMTRFPRREDEDGGSNSENEDGDSAPKHRRRSRSGATNELVLDEGTQGQGQIKVLQATMQRTRSVGSSLMRSRESSGRITLAVVRDMDDDSAADVAFVVPI